MNKLMGITEMVISLDKLDNANNLKDDKPGDTVFYTYYMTYYEDFAHSESYTSQYSHKWRARFFSLENNA